MCREKIETGLNQFATEVHHIKPLGLYNGPHIKENMIILCPNHHVMFDKGAITIDLSKKTVMHINPKTLLII
ncbi:HNH endonuclease [Bacillus thuringiensis]|uniref:HNH endonuclease n=1 Tax=Bacillus thuringiensis TaxID=1428 RepID=UPI0034E0A514